MDKNQQKILVFSLIAILLVAYIAFTPVTITGATTTGSNTAEASTPYGESIGITIGSGSTTSGEASIIDLTKVASWIASYSDSDSQNVYDVNGTYKSQEIVTLSYSLSVTHSSVSNIQTTVKIKAIDKDTSANNHEYTLANAKTISGASPINDNGNTQPTISQHLTSIGGSTTSETIQYQIYCQVTATGTVSGETLTATVNYTPFGTLEYTQTSESSTAEVTPTVSVASIIQYKASAIDNLIGLPEGWTIQLVAIASVTVAIMVVKKQYH